MFLFIDNYDSFSYNIVQYFQELGEKPIVLTHDDPRILKLASDPQLEKVVISPGPSKPENAGYCLEFLARLPHHIPVLGICLGHQCLGYFAGCPVVRGFKVMHGKTSLIEHKSEGLYKGLKNPMRIGRYHSLVVKCPDNHPLIEVTARDEDGEVMSMRYKDRPWVGVQYHPESILTEQGKELLANFPHAILGKDEKELSISEILDKLASCENLNMQEAKATFSAIFDDKLTHAQAGAFLLALRSKGETDIEITAAVNAALERAIPINGLGENLIDIVGTGGDGKKSFNCSTATAIYLAALGYPVLKHGNRAVSSSSGAGDVLENIGYPIPTQPDELAESLKQYNFGFAFAPYYHPSFKNIAPLRQELGIRTLFNLLGPLINPARPNHILLGVAKPELVPTIAKVLANGNYKRAMVVHGAGGYDELTCFGPATAYLVEEGRASTISIDPADFNFARPSSEAELYVKSQEEASAIFIELLHGRGPRAMLDMLALNLGVAIYLLEPNLDLCACMSTAREAVIKGKAAQLLQTWQQA